MGLSVVIVMIVMMVFVWPISMTIPMTILIIIIIITFIPVAVVVAVLVPSPILGVPSVPVRVAILPRLIKIAVITSDCAEQAAKRRLMRRRWGRPSARPHRTQCTANYSAQ